MGGATAGAAGAASPRCGEAAGAASPRCGEAAGAKLCFCPRWNLVTGEGLQDGFCCAVRIALF